jgi:hypothetical protein
MRRRDLQKAVAEAAHFVMVGNELANQMIPGNAISLADVRALRTHAERLVTALETITAKAAAACEL